MTKEQALEVKSVLLEIRDSIPATYVDRIFYYYRSYIDPSYAKPCTCQPKYWNAMLIALKDKVEETLASYDISEDKQQTTLQEERT